MAVCLLSVGPRVDEAPHMYGFADTAFDLNSQVTLEE